MTYVLLFACRMIMRLLLQMQIQTVIKMMKVSKVIQITLKIYMKYVFQFIELYLDDVWTTILFDDTSHMPFHLFKSKLRSQYNANQSPKKCILTFLLLEKLSIEFHLLSFTLSRDKY